MAETEDLYEAFQLHRANYQNLLAAYRQLLIVQLKCVEELSLNREKRAEDDKNRLVRRLAGILSYLEKRADYDRNRQVQSVDPSSLPTRRAAETDSADRSSKRMTRQSSPDYLTIGIRKDDVARIQGPPDSTTSFDTFEGETWGYGSGNTFCSISFNRAGRVEG